jgi:hypothetical protein
MMRTGTMLGLAAILSVALASSAPAADVEKEKSKLDEILEKLSGIDAKLNSIEARTKLTEKEIQILQLRLDKLQERVSALEDLEKKLKQAAAQSRSSFYPPSTSTSALPGTGTVRLENTSFTPVSVRINDRAFDVLPRQTIVVDNQVAGPFTYSVSAAPFGEFYRTTTTLEAGKEVRIILYPR